MHAQYGSNKTAFMAKQFQANLDPSAQGLSQQVRACVLKQMAVNTVNRALHAIDSGRCWQ